MVEAVDAVQRCFEKDVKQCFGACPPSLRVKSLGTRLTDQCREADRWPSPRPTAIEGT